MLRFVELHPILHSGTTARFNKNAQPLVAVLRIFRDKVVQSSKGRVCHSDHYVPQLSDTFEKCQRLGGRVWRSAFNVWRSTFNVWRLAFGGRIPICQSWGGLLFR